MPTFVPGAELNATFYRTVVAPLVPVPHAAALLGPGSDVLGYDTARSTDHGWGLHLQVFVASSSVGSVTAALDAGLPSTFEGWPVRYGWDDVAPQHHVGVLPFGEFLRSQIGFDSVESMGVKDWLLVSQQALLGLVRGAVFADPSGELAAARSSLAYFPDPVWRWMLACQWVRISQEEAFVGRCAEVGDELGSRLVAGRLSLELMRLAFLLERVYWPYTKWFGTAFASLGLAASLTAPLSEAVTATSFSSREASLVSAYELVAQAHNSLGITSALDPSVRPYYSRPFRVLMSERFAEASFATVSDPWLRSLPRVGSVDQFVDSTDVLSAASRARRLEGMFGAAS